VTCAGKGGTAGTDDRCDAEEPGRDTDAPDRERVDFAEMESEVTRAADATARGRAEADSVIDVLRVLETAEMLSASLEESSCLALTLTSGVAVAAASLFRLDCAEMFSQ
jgi:hypothetical protein